MDKKLVERLLRTCAWCNLNIDPEEEIFAFGAKTRTGLDLKDKQGEFVSLNLALSDKTVVALVPTETSQAKQVGYDLIFVACSEDCAVELKEALEFEKDVFEERL
jgi:hypothetical protein